MQGHQLSLRYLYFKGSISLLQDFQLNWISVSIGQPKSQLDWLSMNKKYFAKALTASEQRSRHFFSSLSFSLQLMLSDYLSYTISASLTGKIVMSLARCCRCLQFSINSWQAGNKNFYSLTLSFCQFLELCSNLISALDILLPQNQLLNGSMFPLS